mmetsp:Transcript_25427/g.65474  ORF Transcript_25427/g.65474 Transcript_25427/m.65474 type:complete len:366 (-) Transcript_25427:680-1777(-)
MALLRLDAPEVARLVRAHNGAVALLLLVHLPVVHQLFQRAQRHEAVHIDVALLADAKRAVLRLQVRRGIPVRVEQHHLIGGGEVEAEAACASGHQEDKARVRIVEVVDSLLAVLLDSGAVQADVAVPAARHQALQDVEHAGGVAEQQHLGRVAAATRALARPARHQLLQRRHLAAVRRVAGGQKSAVGAQAAQRWRVVPKHQRRLLLRARQCGRVARHPLRVRLHQLQMVGHLLQQRDAGSHKAGGAARPLGLRGTALRFVALAALRVGEGVRGVGACAAVQLRPEHATLLARRRPVAAALAVHAAATVTVIIHADQELEVGGRQQPLVGPQLHRAQAAQHDVVRLLRELVPDGVVLGAAQQVLV